MFYFSFSKKSFKFTVGQSKNVFTIGEKTQPSTSTTV